MKRKLIIFMTTSFMMLGCSVGVFASTSDTDSINISNEKLNSKEDSNELEETKISAISSGQNSLESEQNENFTQYIDENGNKYLLYSDGTHYMGWYDMQPYGELYYDPENDGVAITSRTEIIDGNAYLFDTNGLVIKKAGTPIINDEKYWVKEDGTLDNGWLILGNWKMYFDPETYQAKTVTDGVTDINGKKYLFNKDGVMQNYAGTTIIDGKKYWFSTDDASLKTGWLTLGNWKLYFDPETYQCATGITEINGKKYLFDSNGILQTSGTPIINGKKYYIGEDNTLQSGWISIGNRKIYIDSNTYEMAIGIKEVNGKKLIFDKNGLLVEGSGTFTVDGKKYAYDSNGNAITGWIKLGHWKMYFNPETGVAAVGIVKIDGKDYLFDNNGVMQDYAGTTIVNGKKYWFSTDNASLKSGWLDLGSVKMYFDPVTYAAYTSTKAKIDGFTYEFDANGCVKNCITVGKGKMCSTIMDAVQTLANRYSELYSSSTISQIAKIEISDGTYIESLNLDGVASSHGGKYLNGIYFQGKGNVYILSAEAYPYGAMYSNGSNKFENLNFTATHSGAYAYHYEAGANSLTAGNQTIFKNCNFVSEEHQGVGIGSGYCNTNILFDGCTFKGKSADIYFHNSTSGGAYNNLITFKNCKANTIVIHDAARINSNRNSNLKVCFQNNTFGSLSLYCGNEGPCAGKTYSTIPIWYDNINLVDSYGNSNSNFDN